MEPDEIEELEDVEITYFDPQDVIIEVLGGVASVTKCPPHQTTRIVDFDNYPDAYIDYENCSITWGEPG